VITVIAALLFSWDYSQIYLANKSFNLNIPIENEVLKKYAPWFVEYFYFLILFSF
jgi:hypothetical protein